MKKVISAVLASVLLANNFAYAQTQTAQMTLVQRQQRYKNETLPALEAAFPSFGEIYTNTTYGLIIAVMFFGTAQVYRSFDKIPQSAFSVKTPEISDKSAAALGRRLSNVTDEEMLKAAVDYSRKKGLSDLENILRTTKAEDIYSVLADYELKYNEKAAQSVIGGKGLLAELSKWQGISGKVQNSEFYFIERARMYEFINKYNPGTMKYLTEEIKISALGISDVERSGFIKGWAEKINSSVRIVDLDEAVIRNYIDMFYGKSKGADKLFLLKDWWFGILALLLLAGNASAEEQAKIKRLGENMALFPQMDAATLNKIEKDEPEFAASLASVSDALYELSKKPEEDIKNILSAAEQGSKEKQKEFDLNKYNELNKKRTVNINSGGIGFNTK